MYLNDLHPEQLVTILAYVGSEHMEFNTMVEETGASKGIIHLAPILRNEKPVSFSGKSIQTHLLAFFDEQIPHVFRNVHLTLTRRDRESVWYTVTASAASVPYNRRRYYRCYIGLDSVVRIGAHRAAHNAIIKDLSIGGFGFVVSPDVECSIGEMVHFSLSERIPEVSKVFSFSIYGIIVNKRELENGNIVCGCRMTSNPANIDSYIATKERLRLQKERSAAAASFANDIRQKGRQI